MGLIKSGALVFGIFSFVLARDLGSIESKTTQNTDSNATQDITQKIESSAINSVDSKTQKIESSNKNASLRLSMTNDIESSDKKSLLKLADSSCARRLL